MQLPDDQSRPLFGRRVEAFVADAFVKPLAFAMWVGVPCAGLLYWFAWQLGMAIGLVVGAAVFVRAVVSEATNGRSGGKAAVDLRIVKVSGASASALLIRACVKWLTPVFVVAMMVWIARLRITQANLPIGLIAVGSPVLWLALMGRNASVERGWLDRLCGTAVVDADTYVEPDQDRGFEVKV